MGTLSICLCTALVLIISVSAKPQQFHEARREYQYERSYSASGQHSGAGLSGGYQRLTNFQDLGLSSAWAQRHQDEVRRMAERLQSEFNAAMRTGGGGGSRYEKIVQFSSSGGMRPDECDQLARTLTQQTIEDLRSGRLSYSQIHQPQFFINRAAQKLEEQDLQTHQVVQSPSGHHSYSRVVESSSNQQPPVVVPVSQGQSSRVREEQYRRTYQQPQPVPQQRHYHHRVEEERREVIPPRPVTVQRTHSQRTEQHEEQRKQVVQPVVNQGSHTSRQEYVSQNENVPVYGNSYFSSSLAERHRQHGHPRPFNQRTHHTSRQEEEYHRQQQPIVVPTQKSYKHERVEEEYRRQQQPVVVPTQRSYTREHVEEEYRRQQQPVVVPTQRSYSREHVEEEHRRQQKPVVIPTQKTYSREHVEEEHRRQEQPVVIPTQKTYSREHVEEEYRHRQQPLPRPITRTHTEEKKEEVYNRQYVPVAPTRTEVIKEIEIENTNQVNRQYEQRYNTQNREETHIESRNQIVYPTWVQKETDRKIYEHYYTQRVPRVEFGRELTREEKVEFEEYYRQQGGTTAHEVEIEDRRGEYRYEYPRWVKTEADRRIFENFCMKFLVPRPQSRTLSRNEEQQFEQFYRQQGGTTLREERKEEEEFQVTYPSWVVTTEQKSIFDEYYKARVGQNYGRQLSQSELSEFRNYYNRRLEADRFEQEDIYKAVNYQLTYPSWVVSETDKKIFEEYYFSTVEESDYGRELTRDERVEFEEYYRTHGGTTQHEVETAQSYHITYPSWIKTVEDRAIYDEYYLSVVGYEEYGRELTETEAAGFETYYRQHGGTTVHQVEETEETEEEYITDLRSRITYPSWLVTAVDRVIYEDFYRINVDRREWGRQLTTTELTEFYEYYKQRGGDSRQVLEERIFSQLTYPQWVASEQDRSLFREFYLRRVEQNEYGRQLTTEELTQFREYYVRHRYENYQKVNGQIDYQFVYPSWVTSRSDRRIFNEYYLDTVAEDEWGRELTDTEKVDFQQFFIERGGLYEYRYAREEYILSFSLDRIRGGGSGYHWTWDGLLSGISDKRVSDFANSVDGHHTDDYDRRHYGTTREEEPLPEPAPIEYTTPSDRGINRPGRVEINKDRGDQPPQVYEETEVEPGVGEYVPPDDTNLILPTVRPLEPGPRPEPYQPPAASVIEGRRRHEQTHQSQQVYAPPPTSQTEYRRRYQHKVVSSQVVPSNMVAAGSDLNTVSVDLGGAVARGGHGQQHGYSYTAGGSRQHEADSSYEAESAYNNHNENNQETETDYNSQTRQTDETDYNRESAAAAVEHEEEAQYNRGESYNEQENEVSEDTQQSRAGYEQVEQEEEEHNQQEHQIYDHEVEQVSGATTASSSGYSYGGNSQWSSSRSFDFTSDNNGHEERRSEDNEEEQQRRLEEEEQQRRYEEEEQRRIDEEEQQRRYEEEERQRRYDEAEQQRRLDEEEQQRQYERRQEEHQEEGSQEDEAEEDDGHREDDDEYEEIVEEDYSSDQRHRRRHRSHYQKDQLYAEHPKQTVVEEAPEEVAVVQEITMDGKQVSTESPSIWSRMKHGVRKLFD